MVYVIDNGRQYSDRALIFIRGTPADEPKVLAAMRRADARRCNWEPEQHHKIVARVTRLEWEPGATARSSEYVSIPLADWDDGRPLEPHELRGKVEEFLRWVDTGE